MGMKQYVARIHVLSRGATQSSVQNSGIIHYLSLSLLAAKNITLLRMGWNHGHVPRLRRQAADWPTHSPVNLALLSSFTGRNHSGGGKRLRS